MQITLDNSVLESRNRFCLHPETFQECKALLIFEKTEKCCAKKALLLAGYDDIVLKVKQVICLESLYLKKDLVAVLPTGYGKSLVFQVLPQLLRERDTRANTSVAKSVVLVVLPLNTVMYDQISKLRARGVDAARLGVKKGNNTDLLVISQWEGARESIIQAGYEIVFCHPEVF